MPGPADSSVAPATREAPRLVRIVRYFTGSVIATVCSEITFVVLYGAISVGTAWSSVLAWLAGAIPNFWLNRNWAWQRTGRPNLRREVLPYAVIILTTLLLAMLLTHLADAWLQDQDVSSSVRVTLVASVFMGTYVVVFILRFVLLERLFNGVRTQEQAADQHRESAT